MTGSRRVQKIAAWFSIGAGYALIAAFCATIFYAALPLTGAIKPPAPRIVTDNSTNTTPEISVMPVATEKKIQILQLSPNAFMPPVR